MRVWASGLLVVGSWLIGVPSFGQSASCSFPLTVEVVGEKPAFRSLDAKNLAIRLHGKSVAVKDVRLRSDSQVLVVFDNSGSMQGKGRQRQSLLVLTKDILDGIPATVKDIGLTAFANVAVHVRGREDALRAVETLKGQPAYGRTRLLDSMEDSARFFQARPGTLMIVISDGGDNYSREDLHSVNRELLRRGVRVTLIMPKEMEPPGTVEEMMTSDALELADATGGNVIYLDMAHVGPAEHVFAPDATARLMEYFDVSVDASNAAGKLRAELLDASGKKARDLKLHYPREVNCVK